MRTVGISGRIDRIERELGCPDEDKRRFIEGLQAIAEGREYPHETTPRMRQLITRALLELDNQASAEGREMHEPI